MSGKWVMGNGKWEMGNGKWESLWWNDPLKVDTEG